jgi:hypothetical protein
LAAEKLQYTSTIRDFPLLFLEMKRTAILLCEGKSAEEILQLSIENNIYQLNKEKRRRSMPLKMTKRLLTIDKPLWEILASGTAEEAKLIAFFALMKAERLVHDYMFEVYADKADNDEIHDIDFIHFIDRKASNSEIVAAWNADTIKSINTKIKQILCDAGLAKKTKTGLIVQKPIVYKEFCGLFNESDWIYAKAMLGEDSRP